MRDDDQKLLGRFIESRDENAFQRLVEKYHRLVFSAALRRLGSRELAEEATQNTFTILARKGTNLRNHPALGGWLHRAAMLEASSIARAEKTRRRKHAEHTKEVKIAMMSGDAEGDKLPIRLVDEAIAKLPPNDRDVLILRFYEELSFDEIASRLGQSAAACQKRSGRAVLKLARHLNRMGIATPTTSAIGIAIASGLASESSTATSLTVAKLAVARSNQVGMAEIIRNALLTMNYGKLTISISITLALLIPIAVEAKKSRSIKREITLATQQLADVRTQSHQSDTQSIPPQEIGTATTDAEPGAEETSKQSPIEKGATFIGNLKREEIRYWIKYADGVPGPKDDGYAEYLNDMDAFMRVMNDAMTMEADPDEDVISDIDDLSVQEKVTFLGILAATSLDLDDSQIDGLVAIIEKSLNTFDFFPEDDKPEEPEALHQWEEVRRDAISELWDDVHAYLTPEQQLKMEKGFSKKSVRSRNINLSFPNRSNTETAAGRTEPK